MDKPPEVIYLQWKLFECSDEEWGDIAWCQDKQDDSEIEYVRMDRLEKLRDDPFDGLTDDENDTVKLYVSGHSPSEICDQLGIHRNTFQNRINKVCRKLGLEKPLDIIRLWHEKFDLILSK